MCYRREAGISGVGKGLALTVEHGEELPRRHNHVVAKPSSNNRVMHDWLVGLLLEVTVPATSEILARPRVHHIELSFRGTDLDTRLDTISSQRASPVNVPLLEHGFLHLGVSAHKVVERLDVRFGTVGGEGKATQISHVHSHISNWGGLLMVLEIESHTGQVDEGLDADLAELLWVADARALQDKGRTEGAARDDDLLARSDDSAYGLVGREGFGGHDLYAHGAIAFENDL